MAGVLLIKICVFLIFQHAAEAVWKLTGSANVSMTGEAFTLTCTPDSRNVTKITWGRKGFPFASVNRQGCTLGLGSDTRFIYTCDNGPVYRLTIPASSMTPDQHNVIWRCDSTVYRGQAEYRMAVVTPVRSVIFTGEANYTDVNIIYRNVPKTFTCSTNGCLPKANVTVIVSGASGEFIETTEETLPNGLTVTKRSHKVRATRIGSTKTISCIAVNIEGRQPIVQTITLDMYYEPTITLNTDEIVIQEGSSFNRTCSAVGYPTPVSKWYRNNTQITFGATSMATVSVTNTSRDQAGNYTCRATAYETANRQLETEASILVTVQYPPSAVVVVPDDVLEGDTNVEIMCNITMGVPAVNIHHTWSHFVGDVLIRSDLNEVVEDENYKLVLQSVSFEDIGRYQCLVGNGIKGKQPTAIQSAAAMFDVTVSAQFNSSDAHKTGEAHKDWNLNFPFYSNPFASLQSIKWTNVSDGKQLKQTDYISLDLVAAKVFKQIYNKTVLLDGQTARLTLKPFEGYHVGNYIIEVANGGSLKSSFHFEITASGPPDSPSNFGMHDRTASSIILKWNRGFNGGHLQTFVILYNRSGTIKEEFIEEKRSQSFYTCEIIGLNASTAYQFWIYSVNEMGNSSLVSKVIVTGKETSYEMFAIAAGCGLAGVGVIIAIIVVLKRNNRNAKGQLNNRTRSPQYTDLLPNRKSNPYDHCNERPVLQTFQSRDPTTAGSSQQEYSYAQAPVVYDRCDESTDGQTADHQRKNAASSPEYSYAQATGTKKINVQSPEHQPINEASSPEYSYAQATGNKKIDIQSTEHQHNNVASSPEYSYAHVPKKQRTNNHSDGHQDVNGPVHQYLHLIGDDNPNRQSFERLDANSDEKQDHQSAGNLDGSANEPGDNRSYEDALSRADENQDHQSAGHLDGSANETVDNRPYEDALSRDVRHHSTETSEEDKQDERQLLPEKYSSERIKLSADENQDHQSAGHLDGSGNETGDNRSYEDALSRDVGNHNTATSEEDKHDEQRLLPEKYSSERIKLSGNPSADSVYFTRTLEPIVRTLQSVSSIQNMAKDEGNMF